MNSLNTTMLIAFTITSMACGSQDEHKPESPTVINLPQQTPAGNQNPQYPTENRGYSEVPAENSNDYTPNSAYNSANTASNGQLQQNTASLEDSETKYQDDYNQNDFAGNPYTWTSDVPYSAAYGTNQANYGPSSQNYYNDINVHMKGAYQGYSNYSNAYNRPYLGKRYHSQRQFLNYNDSFKRVRPGHHSNWNDSKHRDVGHHMKRSTKWVNYDVYNLITRTLSCLEREQYKSRSGLEHKIRRAINSRDHRNAVRLHDEILAESSDHGNRRNSSNRRFGRGNNTGNDYGNNRGNGHGNSYN
jgi:hypothetical protein